MDVGGLGDVPLEQEMKEYGYSIRSFWYDSKCHLFAIRKTFFKPKHPGTNFEYKEAIPPSFPKYSAISRNMNPRLRIASETNRKEIA